MRRHSPRNKIKIPRQLQSVLWSTDINLLDPERDKGYIIHQILIYGTLQHIKWLFATYSKKEIIDVFLHVPYRNYPKENFYFIKNYILGLRDDNISADAYVTSIHGPLKPRAAGSF